jgi:hypothetical protein
MVGSSGSALEAVHTPTSSLRECVWSDRSTLTQCLPFIELHIWQGVVSLVGQQAWARAKQV